MTAASPTLEWLARHYAALDVTVAEALIDGESAQAVRECRMADATFWQRVRYRSRMLRLLHAPRTRED